MKKVSMIHYNTLSCEPVLRKAPDGSFVVLCQCDGLTEPAPQNRVYVFRSTDGGESWDNVNMWRKGRLVIPDDGKAVYQTEMFVLGGRMTAFLTVHNGAFLDWDCRLLHSDDSGLTWYDGGKNPWFDGFVFMRGALTLKNGHIAICYQHYPVSREENEALKRAEGKKRWLMSSDAEYLECGVVLSEDGGKTYEKLPPVKVPLQSGGKRNWVWGEPTAAQLSDGRLCMLMRMDGAGRLYKCCSSDEGRTWSAPERTDIPNPDNKPKLLQHSDGRIFLINTPDERHGHRYPLELWVSRDDMHSWQRQETLMGDTGYYSYTDGFIDEEKGKLYCVFENRHDIFFAEVDI